ncbi:hypothetical protein ACFWN1_23450 [Streptomyces sp. NPDC058459]|uniref:hypothetical protein n=1 Tax=Streptomyces sp. NPDC058459 TaxID=3346508 RepID=UPI00364B3C97
MHGQGAQPPARSAGTGVFLRVVLIACAVLSCGLFACVPLFRVAYLRGRGSDWLLAWAGLATGVVGFAVVGSVPENNASSDIALAAILMLAVAASVHFLVVDVRLQSGSGAAPQGYAPPAAQTVPSAYGYPSPAAPYTATPTPTATPPTTPPTTPPYPPSPQPPQGIPPQPPAPPRPAPARIDQVRAELDELSDYLRRQDGKPEGGR